MWLWIVYRTVSLVRWYHDLGVGSGLAILVRRGGGIRVDSVHIVIQELGLDGLLGRLEVVMLLQVLRRILAIMGWWVAHRPGTRMTLIQASETC
jgi:hypothetical protein